MKVIGIICEYNPYHNGHNYQIEAARAKSGAHHVVCVMSGNFVQRGEPAIMDKWSRAHMAVLCGADLVLELPAYYAISSAEGFACGGVLTLAALGLVDYLSFGMEADYTHEIHELAQLLAFEPPHFSDKLAEFLRQGRSFAQARAMAADSIQRGSGEVLAQPNNILALEYLKWLIRMDSAMIPLPIKRHHAPHDSLQAAGGFASATLLRSLLKQNADASPYMPPPAALIAREYTHYMDISHFEGMLLYLLRTTQAAELKNYRDVGEGLENRLIKAGKMPTLEQALCSARSKRYPLSRIKRILCNILLKNTLPSGLMPQYIRPLAMNERGMEILKSAKRTAGLPIVTKAADVKKGQFSMMEMDFLASNVYSIPKNDKKTLDLLKSPVIILDRMQ